TTEVVAEPSCRAGVETPPGKLPLSCGTGFLDFARNDNHYAGSTITRTHCISRIARVLSRRAGRGPRGSNPYLMDLHCVAVCLQSEEAGESRVSRFQHAGETPLLLPARDCIESTTRS